MILFLLFTVWSMWALYGKSQAKIARTHGAYEITHIAALITLPVPILATAAYFIIFYPMQ